MTNKIHLQTLTEVQDLCKIQGGRQNNELISQSQCFNDIFVLCFQLMLNAMQAEYEDWTTVAGLQVITHEPRDSVFPNTNGYGVSTGYDTSFSFRKGSRLVG